MIVIPKPTFMKFKRTKKVVTQTSPVMMSGLAHSTLTEDTLCKGVKHPSVADNEHHFHVSPVNNNYEKICCRCGYNLNTGKYLGKADLKKFNETYW